MSLLKYINRIQHIDLLIRTKSTGNSYQFAKKIGVSRAILMEHLRDLKELGANINYCRFRSTYYYPDNKNLKIEFDYAKKANNPVLSDLR